MFALEAIQLKKTFFSPGPTEVLKGVDLSVPEGTSVAIMGKSGEGKSTLIHILGTLENPSSGTLKILGKNADAYDGNLLRNQKLGFVFQSYHLLEDYTVLENVLLPAKIGRSDVSKKSEKYQKALLLIEEVGLSDRKDMPVKKLSGGEKQRACIARAFLNDPEILFADEPSGNLDRASSIQVHEMLLYFTKAQKKTLILVTHDLLLANLCDWVFLLRDGKLEKQTKVELCTS